MSLWDSEQGSFWTRRACQRRCRDDRNRENDRRSEDAFAGPVSVGERCDRDGIGVLTGKSNGRLITTDVGERYRQAIN